MQITTKESKLYLWGQGGEPLYLFEKTSGFNLDQYYIFCGALSHNKLEGNVPQTNGPTFLWNVNTKHIYCYSTLLYTILLKKYVTVYKCILKVCYCTQYKYLGASYE